MVTQWIARTTGGTGGSPLTSGTVRNGQAEGTKDGEEVLSLAEILAEGLHKSSSPSSSPLSSDEANEEEVEELKAASTPASNAAAPSSLAASRLNKAQLKRLQESAYHAAESANLELALDLRNLGVPWTVHVWTRSLAVAHDALLLPVVNELLQDFDPSWAMAQSPNSGTMSGKADVGFFCDVALPLLFAIFRACKNEGTVLVLADLFSVCFGRNAKLEPTQEGRDESKQLSFTKTCSNVGLIISSASADSQAPRIDPKFVNNPELSDVQFRIEGRIFYAHRLALVSASPRFRSMLASSSASSCSPAPSSSSSSAVGQPQTPPVLQINDIRYHVFHLVMEYLYNGGRTAVADEGAIPAADVLELMAAANFFQLPGLLRRCESACVRLVDLDSVVSYYIHARVYSAERLLRFCEAFLLKNLVGLLTYDDAGIRRLLFGKQKQKLDVLSGLMATLSVKIRSRK